MPRRSFLARRSVSEWVIRGLLALAAVVLGYVSVMQTFAYTIRRQVERAHSLSPGDGRITALLAEKLSAPDATVVDRASADRLARLALRQDPTAVLAASTLGLNMQIRGDVQGARRLFGYAERLSRRDLQTQLWAIEEAVARGDIAGAIAHYDIALRTSRNAPDLLFPILASAISDPSIRTALTKKLITRPSWGDQFIAFASARSTDPRSTAQLFLNLRRAGVPPSRDAEAAIIDALIVGGFADDTWAYYASSHTGSDRRRSRDPRFNARFVTPLPLDWMPVNDGGIATSIQQGDHGGVFDFAAPASLGGPLLRQFQLLPPGGYRLEGRSRGIDQPRSSSPYWVLICRNDWRELGRIDLPNSAQNNGSFVGRFDVPVGCPVQILVLMARPSDALSGLSGQIEWVQLSPVSR
jgi:hypothetical protein